MSTFAVHHIGYAVNDIAVAKKWFENLGYVLLEECEDEYRAVKLAMMDNCGYKIELISPSHEKSPISRFLTKNGPMPYHICYQVSCIEKSCELLLSQGYSLVEETSAAPLFHGSLVAFLYQKDVGIVELIEQIEG